MLICPRIRPHETILIRNVRQYKGTGYGGFGAGPHDTTHGEASAAGPASARAEPPEHVLAIDASCYYYVDSSTQYESPAMLRELTSCARRWTAAYWSSRSRWRQYVSP